MSSNYYGSIAGEIADAGPTCRVCNDTGMVQCAETNPEDGVYEQACPEKVHDGQPCLICDGNGYVEGPGCNCGAGPSCDAAYGMHERYCGLEPCPRGCPFVAPKLPASSLLAAKDGDNR